MQVIKFRDQTINGVDKSTLNWEKVASKDELMVEVFTNEGFFEDLAIYWKDLELRVDDEISMSYDWAYSWWKHFGQSKQRSLYIISIWDGTKLVGLAPFYKGYSVFGSLKLETRLQLIGSGGNQNEQVGYLDDSTSGDALDILVDQAYAGVVTECLVEDVLTPGMAGVDVIKFRRAADNSFVVQKLLPGLRSQFSTLKVQHKDKAPITVINDFQSVNMEQRDITMWFFRQEQNKTRGYTKKWNIVIPVRKRRMNIPLLLNRAGAFLYKFFAAEIRLMKMQRRQKGFIKMVLGYLRYRLRLKPKS